MELYWYRAELVKVVDGDTMDLSVDLGFNIRHRVRIRLLGVDTPEIFGSVKGSSEWDQGMAAKELVEAWFATASEVLVKVYKTKEKYGRWLGEIFDGEANPEKSLNESLKWAGFGISEGDEPT